MADPTIDQVFEEFLEEQYARWKPSTVSKCEDVVRGKWRMVEVANVYPG